MWRIGKALTDPVKSPPVMVFYGATGHEGKSMLATNITRILGDAVRWLSKDLFGFKGARPEADMALCEKRILVCDECKPKDRFSYNNIKRWTSEALIAMKELVGYLCQSAIIVTNEIPLYEITDTPANDDSPASSKVQLFF
ncbi:hypothetical protein W97_08396 [Coniosporium apollinis CBS 100218]|uniref:Uncharacterized protein n=1 Tax=Coniosporium apollinis (strain CBS 100218) TaxID=1168221 RepID=R7Z4S1_CONA1|nr:uncharacterized protein W97_08396 [Coniosporium apollinis CBS 100218]EON69083.1 hypothetical protein W97_08396 [Coniosporium apollinis CBS 100218]